MRIIFLGSPKEVIPPLEALLALKGHNLVAVVSQPAKPHGRKRLPKDPPIAAYAKLKGLLVLQPISSKDSGFLAEIRQLKPDMMVTAAYGQILSDDFLSIPTKATINLHPSLLPKYRGATPVQTALLNGDTHTGLTILYTVKKLDAGAMILQQQTAIEKDDTTESLLPRMFAIAASMLPNAINLLEQDDFQATAQNEADITHCRKITKEDGLIDWQEAPETLLNKFRAFHPWPGSYTFLNEKRVVITRMATTTEIDKEGKAGSFIFNKKLNELHVQCDGREGRFGCMIITGLKPAGAKEQDARSFWNGLKIQDRGQFDG